MKTTQKELTRVKVGTRFPLVSDIHKAIASDNCFISPRLVTFESACYNGVTITTVYHKDVPTHIVAYDNAGNILESKIVKIDYTDLSL